MASVRSHRYKMASVPSHPYKMVSVRSHHYKMVSVRSRRYKMVSVRSHRYKMVSVRSHRYKMVYYVPTVTKCHIFCSSVLNVFGQPCQHLHGPGSSVGVATRYGLDGPGIESRWGRDFLYPSRPALGPSQPPIHWVPGLSRVQSGWGVALTTHPHLAPRLRKE